MQFSQALAGVDTTARSGPDPELTGVEYDSRRVTPGALFVAMRGETVDGNRYIGAAIEKGAGAILTDSAEAMATWSLRTDVAIAQVPHGRQAMALVAANFFGHPERQLAVSGVTGTNGKTTTTFLLESLLQHAQRKTALVGTIEYHLAGQVLPSPHTTPESRDLLALFRQGVDAGVTEAVMEVSSHALAQGRVYGIPYDVAIFTNLTRDHLDFHGSMQQYFAAKRMLFDASLGQPPRVSVLNLEDPHGAELALTAREHGSEIYSYGFNTGEFRAEDVQLSGGGMRFHWHTPFGHAPVTTRLIGRVNVYNLLAASAGALARGLAFDQVVESVAHLHSVPGRFQTIDEGQPFTVVVDYAHTDDALRNLIALARDLVHKHKGRVITLFGCGGDRDRTKRPLMGQAAAEGSDVVVLTSDNPRSEDPEAILADVLPGLTVPRTWYMLEPDRARGIRMALEIAQPGDIVLLAGKGHEKTQTLRHGTIPFDDVAVAAAVLREMRFAGASQ
ncbi:MULTISPECIES: UDP-N-acetylmuramoyl-L-alanyl-D-glutamate--2,6-diaminopimelate ligase [Acidobacterium]|uniref:UDP-N-acetylmuramoyl-L-alanyl-D-glutamate--2,6-diaminopimelate ligase n=1 Tax=Acidobacterium capsulatum (strain ATCC 51196 / DSM 11244 / BCRC 80197 / JCM 7670 / NBRC 15755 / NCIMB 13165 / 161) TaxID=240015 RepID=C1F463_ACIC5|nr:MULTISPECIES: UDP-N-acetylmuramoyl-L-alanyl-D-glutamate--2,6-diaminopimelate ligase [Acidobacterium]ACO34041.1 UDP-N-acetylmuramoyl-L-alanyl-D-glutamate--2,6-diaminopimelate ligase [Acidobacterium capsulatum ATCC 51196]HCT60319.1 UDP-N-acetylmuramoyl-L-alanyl-D-glutamate--2,6-diaminopimelate ligase [Acidobacterium sp.]